MDTLVLHLDKIQLALIFVDSFLLSRLIIATKISERLVLYLIGKKHLPIIRIVFYIIGVSAFLSLFIPNVITVLTLLPVIKLLSLTFEQSLPNRYREIETLMPLTLIYGANIGGMGSITGTPANGIMVVYATLHNISGVEYLSFAYWLLWGIPIVAVFALAAWGVLSIAFRLWTYNNELVWVRLHEADAFHPLQRIAIGVMSVSFALFVVVSALMRISTEKPLILTFTGLFTLVLIILLFGIPLRGAEAHASQYLLHLRDCYTGLPWRGLAVVGLILVLLGVGALLHIQDLIMVVFDKALYRDVPLWLSYLIIAALTSFSTEVFSNTVVQLAMFTVIIPVLGSTNGSAFYAFLIITFSCTNAFMTPIATGVNGLAFGEMKGISFVRMLTVGLVMKSIGVFIIAFGLPYLLHWLL